MYIVSACLMGVNCKYNGESNLDENVKKYLKGRDFTLICPEQLGGLTTPRNPVEIKNNHFYDEFGNEYTEQFNKGAHETLKIIEMYSKIEEVILKDGSPSCGSTKIYDGNFCGKKINGKGCTAKLLIKKGYKVKSEKDVI